MTAPSDAGAPDATASSAAAASGAVTRTAAGVAATIATSREVDTPHGPARITVYPGGGRGVLLLGHGAGGGVSAPDLVAATGVGLDTGLHVVLVEQPYRVAGRRAPAPVAQLDAAWLAVVTHVRESLLDGPLVFGGRSSGARVACRTAGACGAVGVLCLAFPLHPPGRPEKSRVAELDAPDVPVLVIQGERDPFGVPEPAPGREVVLLRGDHSLKADCPVLEAAVATWLPHTLASDGSGRSRRGGGQVAASRVSVPSGTAAPTERPDAVTSP